MSSGEQDLSGYLEPLIHHELSFLAEVDSAPDQHFYKPHVVRGRLEIIGLFRYTPGPGLASSILNHNQSSIIPQISNAIRRYRQCWIPFIQSHSSGPRDDILFAPPMDVHFVWHCHMLSPLHYHADLEESQLGRAIDHRPSKSSELEKKREKTRPIWMEMFPHEPFDPPPHDGLPKLAEDEAPAFAYDIERAAERQKVFYYQVSDKK